MWSYGKCRHCFVRAPLSQIPTSPDEYELTRCWPRQYARRCVTRPSTMALFVSRA